MRKLAIALAAFAAFGMAAPAMTGAALAQDTKVVIKKHRPEHKRIVIKKNEHRGDRVVIKTHRHHPMHKKVVIKEHG